MGLSIVMSLLSLAVPVALVVVLVMAIRRRGPATGAGTGARGVRRFFQYLLLLALMIVAAIGVSDLLGRLLGDPAQGGEALARTLAFALVGLPLALLIAWWTRRTMLADPGETASVGYGAYLTIATLTTAVVAMVSLQSAVAPALRGRYDGGALGALLVWGGLWFLHWRLASRHLRGGRAWPHLLLGSLIGLGTAVVALALLLGASIETLLDAGGAQVVVGSAKGLAGYGATFLAGALLWARYWLGGGVHLERTAPWLAYVLPVGVGGGLVMAVASASVLLWQVLVWLVGEPAGTARMHFADSPNALAFAVAGTAVWWYHRAILVRGTRTEVSRVHEYLVAAIGLLAAAAGVGMVIVALIESFTPGVDLGVSELNTLLGAVTLLVVGVPLWWVFWTRIRRARAGDAVAEVASPTRRIYLVLLFGIAGIAAVIALIVVVYVLLQDLLAGTASGETIRSMRYALGVLVAAAAVSAYHGAVYREDREVTLPARTTGPRSLLLIGAPAAGLEHALRRATGAHVELVVRSDVAAPPWSEEGVLAALAGREGEDLVILAEADGLRVIPVRR